MAGNKTWITPFEKQCWAVIGASVNMAQIGMVMGAASSLLPGLRAAHIADDDAAASWVAALPGFGLVLGNLAVGPLMTRYGRRTANLVSIAIVALGWTSLVAAAALPLVMAGRLLQGLSCGMSSCLVPLLIGEYASPRHRGAFAFLMTVIMATSTGLVHAVGAYGSWRAVAYVGAGVAAADFAVVLASPESPSWLGERGQPERAARAFRWLRGPDEEDELAAMLRRAAPAPASTRAPGVLRRFRDTVAEREFYLPIVIMMHLYAIGQWAGINLLAPYAGRLVELLAGGEADAALVVLSVDAQRVACSVLAIFLVRRLRRRSMLLAAVGLNGLALLLIATYSWTGASWGQPWAGVALLHLLMATVAVGSLPLPFTVAGEVFPARHKGPASAITSLFSSANMFLSVKTFPALERAAGLHGACVLYAAAVLSCLLVVLLLLPETKDRTLQEIEDEFAGRRRADAVADEKATQLLATFERKA